MYIQMVIYNYRKGNKKAREKDMTKIKATSKKEFETLKKEYREKGYNFITFTKDFVEMEKGDKLVVIEK